MALADHKAVPMKTPRAEKWMICVDCPIGATGAVGTLDGDTLDFTVTRDSQGTYSITYPPCVKAWVQVVAVSASPTIISTVCTARSATAGTATFETHNEAAAATDPANGDTLQFIIVGQPYG